MKAEVRYAPELASALILAIRSIAQSQQGNLETASKSLEETNHILADWTNHNHDWLIADILRREANALLAELESR